MINTANAFFGINSEDTQANVQGAFNVESDVKGEDCLDCNNEEQEIVPALYTESLAESGAADLLLIAVIASAVAAFVVKKRFS